MPSEHPNHDPSNCWIRDRVDEEQDDRRMVANLSEINIDALIEEISPEMPCGEDLEYDPAFIELAELARGIPEKQIGDAVIPGHTPNWPLVRENALALLSRTRDLRVVDIFTQASVHCDGLKGLGDSLGLAASLIEQRWDTLYPQLDANENHDPTHRINVLLGFGDVNSVIQPITRIPLVASPLFGEICLRDIQISAGQLTVVGAANEESIRDVSEITAAFSHASADELEAKANIVANCLIELQRIETAVENRTGNQNRADFSRLKQILQDILKTYSKYAPARTDDDEVDSELAPGAGPEQTTMPLGPIQSRQAVIRVFDEVCKYYKQYEPSSPVPILVTRAKRLVAKDFLDIVKDMVPDGVSQVETFVGGKDEDN